MTAVFSVGRSVCWGGVCMPWLEVFRCLCLFCGVCVVWLNTCLVTVDFPPKHEVLSI